MDTVYIKDKVLLCMTDHVDWAIQKAYLNKQSSTFPGG